MTLRGKHEGVHIQNMHAHDCHQNVTEYSNICYRLHALEGNHRQACSYWCPYLTGRLDRLAAIGAPISQEDQVVGKLVRATPL